MMIPFAMVCVLAVAQDLRPPLSLPGGEKDPFQAAWQLREVGQREDAFLAFLKIPGAQHHAVRLAREEPATYLALLEAHLEELSWPLGKVVAGDLLLALGRRPEALDSYRAAARRVADTEGHGWAEGTLPRDGYVPDAPSESGVAFIASGRVGPFSHGPGSHRDNWLIRRFIALDALVEAEAELERVWQIHRRRSEPHQVEVVIGWEAGEPLVEKRRFEPAGFDGLGLQMALDYAFFLKRQERPEEALSVLREPLLAIDMDRNPNLKPGSPATLGYSLGGFPGGGAYGGVSRKEFIRLAHGAFKDQGQETELIARLEESIRGGENRLRRVLARIRFHEGSSEAALELEEAYVREAAFDPLSAACRLGRIGEDAGRGEEAARHYERALSLPFQEPDLPDVEEVTRGPDVPHHSAAFHLVRTGDDRSRLHADIAGRLSRIYAALGKPVEAFEANLRRLEADPSALERLDGLEELRTRARLIEREAEFREWLRAELPGLTVPAARHHALWVLDERQACAHEIAKKLERTKGTGRSHLFESWRDRYRSLGEDEHRRFLEAVLEADPENASVRLELLELQGGDEAGEIIAALESLLESDVELELVRGDGDYHPTKFRNHFDLAYRLMRRYERVGELDRLRTLGLRIAAGAKPFGNWWEPDQDNRLGDSNDLEEDVGACLTLIVQHADPAGLDELEELLSGYGDTAAGRQLARRRVGSFQDAEIGAAVRWANVPEQVRLLVSDRTVLSLARDEHFLYSGHPWGVAVWDRAGQPVIRVALAEAARVIVTDDGLAWVGTPRGLYRIDCSNWSVGHLWLHGDLPDSRRSIHTRADQPASHRFDNGVQDLALDGQELWISTKRNVQRLDTKTLELRAYSARELHRGERSAFGQLLIDDRYVWVDGGPGLRRYDRKADTWAPVRNGRSDVGLVVLVDDVLFGSVWVNDSLYDRPCIIDRDTLAITVLRIETKPRRKAPCINGPFSLYGTDEGRLVFGAGYPNYVLDEARGVLVEISAPWDPSNEPISSALPVELRRGTLSWSRPIQRAELESTHAVSADLLVRQLDSPSRTLLLTPGELLVLGKADSYPRRYEDPRDEWPHGPHAWDRQEERSGLSIIASDGTETPVGAGARRNVIPGNCVFAVVPDEAGGRSWLCTDLGLAVLDSADRVTCALTRGDGLPGNRIVSGAAVGERVFFASAWGDHGGGLLVADPATAVVTSYHQSDGLSSDKIARIEKQDEGLRLVYDIEYGRHRNYNHRRFTPELWDAAGAKIVEKGVPRYLDTSEASRVREKKYGPPSRQVPYLGGFLLRAQTLRDKTYHCGTRGLCIIERGLEPPGLAIVELEVELTIDPHVQWEAEARQAGLSIRSAADFARFAADPNPYLRARALAGGRSLILADPESFLSTLQELTGDPHGPNRLNVARLLGEVGGVIAIPELRGLLQDPDALVRREAVLALGRLGTLPEIDAIERLLEETRDSSRREEIILVLAPNATPELFELLLEYPISSDGYGRREQIFQALSRSLLTRPGCSEVLLRAYTRPHDPGPASNYGAARFAQQVFQYAGAPILPLLHEALRSKDRIVRSNAARACGSLRDPSSLQPLIDALDLESGLSRASIVWALGELKAEEALPLLTELYVDVRDDERRGRHAGFRSMQLIARQEARYESLRDLEAIGAEWDELRTAEKPELIDPRENEWLLRPETIQAAVKQIGPASAQEFYRRLAAEDDVLARTEAARLLVEEGPEDRPRNLPILRNLLADPESRVRIAAAVSLSILGRADGEELILAGLADGDRWECGLAVSELTRVHDGSRLVFARDALARVAGDPLQRNRHVREQAEQLIQLIPD